MHLADAIKAALDGLVFILGHGIVAAARPAGLGAAAFLAVWDE